MGCGDFKDSKRRTQSDKVLKDKAFAIASNPKHCNWIRTHNHLVHKRTLNHLAKLAK